MNHDSLLDVARRRITTLGNIEGAPPRERPPVPLAAAFPHLGGWPHAPAARTGAGVDDSRGG